MRVIDRAHDRLDICGCRKQPEDPQAEQEPIRGWTVRHPGRDPQRRLLARGQ